MSIHTQYIKRLMRQHKITLTDLKNEMNEWDEDINK